MTFIFGESLRVPRCRGRELHDVLRSLRFGGFRTIICEDDRHACSATYYGFLDGCIDVEVLSSKSLPLREIEERPELHIFAL